MSVMLGVAAVGGGLVEVRRTSSSGMTLPFLALQGSNLVAEDVLITDRVGDGSAFSVEGSPESSLRRAAFARNRAGQSANLDVGASTFDAEDIRIRESVRDLSATYSSERGRPPPPTPETASR